MKTMILPLLVVCFSPNLLAMEFVAHRGASHLAPENTLAAVRLAWELGADAVEVDVHLTRDNQVVVIHDETTTRTTGQNHKVAKTNLADLRGLDAGSFKDKRYAGEKIPLISEVLATVPEGKKLLIEIKCKAGVLLPLAQAIARSHKQERIIIMSFDFQVAAAAKTMLPKIPVFWLKSAKKDHQTGAWQPHSPDLIDQVASRRLDGLGLDYRGVTAEMAREVKKHGLKLFVWTVDDKEEAHRLRSLGIDGLITNRPGWMRENLPAD